ncbi:MAG TPA: hypothetical protein VGP72_12630 [Planctomycetota bacterium]|jgi:septal ring factor EnvC (AmiA/AmiB activator)
MRILAACCLAFVALNCAAATVPEKEVKTAKANYERASARFEEWPQAVSDSEKELSAATQRGHLSERDLATMQSKHERLKKRGPQMATGIAKAEAQMGKNGITYDKFQPKKDELKTLLDDARQALANSAK